MELSDLLFIPLPQRCILRLTDGQLLHHRAERLPAERNPSAGASTWTRFTLATTALDRLHSEPSSEVAPAFGQETAVS